MLGDLSTINWFLEYRRLALVEHHETSAGLVFVRTLFEFPHGQVHLPCNTIFKRAVHRYKGKHFRLIISLLSIIAFYIEINLFIYFE